MRSYYTHIRLCQDPLPLKRLDLGSAAMTPDHYALARLPDNRQLGYTAIRRTCPEPGHWLGRRLLETLLEHAESAGIREALGTVLATNVAMLGLVRSMGFTVSPEPGDAMERRISRQLRTVRATVNAQPH